MALQCDVSNKSSVRWYKKKSTISNQFISLYNFFRGRSKKKSWLNPWTNNLTPILFFVFFSFETLFLYFEFKISTFSFILFSEAIGKVKEAFGNIDLLINNAAYVPPLHKVTESVTVFWLLLIWFYFNITHQFVQIHIDLREILFNHLIKLTECLSVCLQWSC